MTHRKVIDVSDVKVEEVHPMPPPGMVGRCRSQSIQLMFDLRKDFKLTDQLRFVGFDQGSGLGVHFVVEDNVSVYDTTCRFEGRPHTTRVTKETYWTCAERYALDVHLNVIRLTNDQFQVFYDLAVELQRLRGPETLLETLIKMKLINALWDQGDDDEKDGERFSRIASRLRVTN